MLRHLKTRRQLAHTTLPFPCGIMRQRLSLLRKQHNRNITQSLSQSKPSSSNADRLHPALVVNVPARRFCSTFRPVDPTARRPGPLLVDFFAASINKYLSQTNPGTHSIYYYRRRGGDRADDQAPGLQQAGADSSYRLGASGPLGGRGWNGRYHRPTRRGRRNTDFAARTTRRRLFLRR